MKRIFAILIACVILFSALSISAFAAEESVDVIISITEGQSFRFTPQKMKVTDLDSDGKLTVNDALIAAHNRAYSGGAEAGYAYEKTEYGLSLTKLGGNTSGNFGYYVNHNPATNLLDEIKNGDIVDACIFEGSYPNLQAYAFLVADKASVRAGDSVTLTLKKITFDENFAPVYTPVRGATISILGQNTDQVTDAEGMVTLQASGVGEVVYTASAPSAENAVIAGCIVTIEENAALDQITEEASADNGSPIRPTDSTAKKGGCSSSIGIGMICVIASSAIGAFTLGRRNKRS